MNQNEAYDVLELSPNASLDDLKKQYKFLAKKWHPDLNQDPKAEEKFKKISEAYQYLTSGQKDQPDFANINVPFDPFAPFGRRAVVPTEHIKAQVTISFKESVLGCQKNLKINRKIKCQDCQGEGSVSLNNGCAKCGGKGRIFSRHGSMMINQTCTVCWGKNNQAPCQTCHQQGLVDAESAINVAIPAGVQNGNVLRLGGMGHFMGNFGPLDQYTDVHLHINVIPEPGLTLDGTSVISELNLSLLEALQGCQKSVKTILGNQDISIPPLSKNKDFVSIPHLGVAPQGDQKVILHVSYPKDPTKLIEALSQEN